MGDEGTNRHGNPLALKHTSPYYRILVPLTGKEVAMCVASLRPHHSRPPQQRVALARCSLASLATILVGCTDHPSPTAPASRVVPLLARAPLTVPAQGQYIFRHWTFGDEPFWTDTLGLNHVVETAVSPATALAVGLKVDAERLPPGFLASADLTSPATTVELLRRDAVVGLEADVTADQHIKSLGITCALCHSTVDNSVTAGVGRRLDGWPNRDLNVGAIVALSPVLPAAVKAAFHSRCPSCHMPSLAFSDVNLGILHDPAETDMDPVRAGRLKNHQYRTTPLRALWQHAPYFHDGSAATLLDVVEHYDRVFGLGLAPQQKADLVEYLRSL